MQNVYRSETQMNTLENRKGRFYFSMLYCIVMLSSCYMSEFIGCDEKPRRPLEFNQSTVRANSWKIQGELYYWHHSYWNGPAEGCCCGEQGQEETLDLHEDGPVKYRFCDMPFPTDSRGWEYALYWICCSGSKAPWVELWDCNHEEERVYNALVRYINVENIYYTENHAQEIAIVVSANLFDRFFVLSNTYTIYVFILTDKSIDTYAYLGERLDSIRQRYSLDTIDDQFAVFVRNECAETSWDAYDK